MEISSVSDWDYVNIIGQYVQLETGKTDEIDPRLLARGFTEQQIKMIQEKKKGSSLNEAISLNLHFKTLGRWKYDKFDFVYTLFNQYDKNGVMPFPGSLSEQPAKIMEIFNILVQLTSETERKNHEKAIKQAKKQGK